MNSLITNATYYVEHEHTLGFILHGTVANPSGYINFSPLRAIVSRGATFKTVLSPYTAVISHLRKATIEDFDIYRVVVPSTFNPATSQG
jgi:hypothetical protein